MPKYKKEWWDKAKQFKVDFITISDILILLERCRNEEEKICLLLLYYSGARPSEIVELKSKNIEIKEGKISISFQTLKKGFGRTLWFPINEHTKMIMDYANKFKKNEKIFKTITKYYHIRDFVYKISDNNLTPYFFRHNRFSRLAQKGISPDELKYFKGAKTTKSVEDYIHIGGLRTKEIAKLID